MPNTINLSTLLEQLEKKATLITSNTRLMQHFQKIYTDYQYSKRYFIFESPNIFSYEVWLKKLWKEYNINFSDLTLLNPQQSHILWEEIIHANNPFFFNIQGVIADVKKAWKLCYAWKIDIAENIFVKNNQSNVDTSMFFRWATYYKNILEKNHWIDLDMLPGVLKTFKKNEPLIISGFDQLSPCATELINVISDNKYFIYNKNESARKINKIAFISEDEEIASFIYWAKNQTPNKKIGCVVFNLNQQRNKLDRMLQRVFREEEYNISAGFLFSECTMISQALKILHLRLIAKKATVKNFCFILESRYFGEAEEKLRSLANKVIYDWGDKHLSLENFIRILKKNNLNLANSLEAFLKIDLPKKLKPSEWVIVFQEYLSILGWPGPYELDSVEYQTHARWLVLLNEYQQMDLLFESIDFKKALFLLENLSRQIIFQAQKKNANIHFLGALEASGLHFDCFWVMGMNEEQFPGVIKFNPFIPQFIQRQHKMPHATYEVEMDFSHRLMQHFLSGGEEIIFSYLTQKENSPAVESFFIRHLSYYEDVNEIFNKAENSSAQSIEIISDTQDIPRLPDEQIKGGTSLIKNQALCPFRAFAKHRLNAASFESLEVGLNARERGNIVHEVLEKFWRNVQTQQNLLSSTTEDINNLIVKITSNTVKRLAIKLSPFFQNIEIQRLQQLLNKWVEYEKKRPNFSILSLEETKTMQLSKLELQIRADRIDRLENGEKMVIDYKTGTLPTLSDFDERPENPQLLLYAISDPEIKSWAFAQVNPAETLLKGRSAEELEIPGIKKIDWHTERRQWEESLSTLANEFIQGKNQIAPKKESTCNTCNLHGLCRIKKI